MFQYLVGTSANSSLFLFVAIAGMFVLMYFTSIRPQKKREKQHNEMMAALTKGDKVMTIGGFMAKVYSVKDTTLVIEILPDNIKAEVSKRSISSKISEDEEV